MASGWPPPQAHGAWQQPRQQQQYYQAAGFSQQHPAVPGLQGMQVALPPPPDVGDGRLRAVDELPVCFRGVFPFRYFNAIQNDCWPAIYDSDSNVVISAPTGGGDAGLPRAAPEQPLQLAKTSTLMLCRQDGAPGASHPSHDVQAYQCKWTVCAQARPPKGCLPGAGTSAGAGKQ
jgi:hypothetical protein